MNPLLTLHHLLLLAGGIHFAILSASALVPRVLDWKTTLQPLPLFLRRLFWVYGVFIVITVISFGVLTLMHADAMAQGDPVARTVAAVITVFWGARLIVQLFIFDASPWLTTVWLRLGYHALTVAFVFMTVIYAWAAFLA